MLIPIVQKIYNPGPGNVQLPNGLVTTSGENGVATYNPFTKGNAGLAFTTCANYGGYHTTHTLTDSEGNLWKQINGIIGDRSSLNTSQEIFAWYCASLVGNPVPPVFTQTFPNGDDDYQALAVYELPAGTVVIGTSARVENDIPPGPNVLDTGALLPVTAPQTPAMMLALCFNVSDTDPVYVATPGQGMTLLDNIWPFGEPGGPNVCVATEDFAASTPGVRAYFNPPPGTPQYWQNIGVMLSLPAAVTPPPPNTTLPLTAAQIASLSAGTAVVQTVSVIPAGTLTLQPPAVVTPPPAPAVPTNVTLVANNGSVTCSFVPGVGGAVPAATFGVTLSTGQSGTGPSPVTISCPNGTPVSADVIAISAAGVPSAPSAASNVVTPTAPANGNPTVKYPIFLNGKFYWAGDWNEAGVTMNYAYASPGVAGNGPVIQFPDSLANEYWLPYPPVNSAGPASNGTNWQLQGTHFTIAVKESQPGGVLQMCWFTAKGTTNDIEATNMLTINDPAYLVYSANGYNVYSIPFTAWTWVAGSVPGWIYKLNINQQGVSPQEYLIDQMGCF